MKKILIMVGLLTGLTGCTKINQRARDRHATRVHRRTTCPLPPTGKPITIYVHGATPFGFIPGVYSSVNYPEGLTPALSMAPDNTYGRVARILNKVAPEQFPIESFYCFGWEGTLNFRTRRQAACRLYHFIRGLRNNELYADTPITVLAFSHGGNVSLNLGYAAELHDDTDLHINQLILLACPVQEPTAQYIKSVIFDQVFAFNSKGDSIQTLDPQGLYPIGMRGTPCSSFFSKRLFKKDYQLLQSEVKVDGKQLGHFDFIASPFLHLLPEAMATLLDYEKRHQLPRVKNEYDHYCMNLDTKTKTIVSCSCKRSRKKKKHQAHASTPCRF